VVTRLGIDATSIAPDGKGISRVQLGTVAALRDLGRHELVVFTRPEAPVSDAVHVLSSLAQSARIAIHVDATGRDAHHVAEAAFKAVGRALRTAVRIESEGIPSTKGSL
jgi:hypothetical protein